MYSISIAIMPIFHAFHSILFEQMSDEIIIVTQRNCRSSLYVTRATIHEDNSPNEFGLFCTEKLIAGNFIGLYNGEWFTAEAFDSLHDHEARSKYAISAVDAQLGDAVVSPPLQGGRPDPKVFPLAMANEPPPGGTANCYLVEYQFLMDEVNIDSAIDQTRHDVPYSALGLVASEMIEPHAELFWHYGSTFPRNYDEGAAANLPKGVSLEDPLTLLSRVPLDCVSACLIGGTVDESDSSSEWIPSEEE